jgi:hypothetical protein
MLNNCCACLDAAASSALKFCQIAKLGKSANVVVNYYTEGKC